MSKVRILIVEDELLIGQNMANSLEKAGYSVLEIVDNTTDARRALEVYQLDVILVDIKLKGREDGISLANYINASYQLPIIFITSHVDNDTIDQALCAKPSAFLVKPYNERELQISIDMALYNYSTARIASKVQTDLPADSHYLLNQHVFIKDNHRFERLEYSDIMWMKAESSYVSISTKLKNYLLTSDTLGSMLEKIDCSWLLRVHRSYAVNINMVQAIEGNQLSIETENIPIGKNYRATIKQHFNIL